MISFTDYALAVYPFLELEWFHRTYYRVLEAFAEGRVRRLMISMPPQHGKSVGATTLLPAYLLGLDPDLRIAIASYSASLASKFNRRVQRILCSAEYGELFPDTTIKRGSKPPEYIRTADEVEIVGREGSLLSVGREGSLTGNRVDCFLLDDLYKDAMEANSPLVRENCWEWYTSVVRTRMHNDSRELLVFTRWHEEDLIGMLRQREPVVELRAWEDLALQQIAELCRAARRLREVARDAVAGHAQRNGADLGLVVADVPVIPLDDQLGVDLAKAEQGHPAAVLGDLDGGGAARKADGLRLLIANIIGTGFFQEAAIGHQFDLVCLLGGEGLRVLELLRDAPDQDAVIFVVCSAHSFVFLHFNICQWRSAPPRRPCTRPGTGRLSARTRPARH